MHRFVGWAKSRRSGGTDNCVEVALAPSIDRVGVRDSKDPNGPILDVAGGAWSAFLADIRQGRFDL